MRAEYYYGVLARFRGDHNEALLHLEPNLQYFERKGDSSRVAAVLYQIGIVNSHLGDYEKSLAAYYRLMNIEQKDGNDYSVGYTLNAIGVILKETQKYTDAERLFKKALIIYDTLNEKKDKAYVFLNLGNLYTVSNQLEVEMNKPVSKGKLIIVDITGQQKMIRVFGPLQRGKVTINTRTLLPGIYFLQLLSSDASVGAPVKFIQH